MSYANLKLFALSSNQELAKKIAKDKQIREEKKRIHQAGMFTVFIALLLEQVAITFIYIFL